MADQGLNKIFVLIGICIYVQLDVVLLPTAAGEKLYFQENAAGDLAIQMDYDGSTSLKISVFYDAKSQSAKDFFGKEITPDLLKKAKQCPGISFVLSPCTTLKDDAVSEEDMIQLCVAGALPDDAEKVGDFIICYSAGKKLDDCFQECNADTNAVNNCVSTRAGAHTCHTCNDNFKLAQNAKGDPLKAISGFKNGLCEVLKSGTLKCPSLNCG